MIDNARIEQMQLQAQQGRLAGFRTHNGFTQAKAAEIVGTNPRQWRRWENGESLMPILERIRMELHHCEGNLALTMGMVTGFYLAGLSEWIVEERAAMTCRDHTTEDRRHG